MSDPVWAIAIHGGAGPAHKSDYSKETAHMRDVLQDAKQALIAGKSALDVVQNAVRELEDCGFHVAGRGSSPNKDGKWELDAAIMDGVTRNAGSVGALRGFKSPINCARSVLDHSPHVFFVGKGATRYLRKRGLERVQNPGRYYKPALPEGLNTGELPHGTVGAVALDSAGRLAAATSTGGTHNKPPGRIGDAPMIGAGTWADERVAVSCTGQGEFFMRCAAAADLSARIRYKKSDLKDAASCVLEDISYMGGQGGLIAIDRLGRVTMPFNTISMIRAFATWRGDLEVKVF